MRSMALTAKAASSSPISTLRPQDWCGKTLQNSPLSGSVTASLGRRTADSLDRKVNATLQGYWLGLFLTELFEGVGQLALFLLLLEAIWEGSASWVKPDVYVLSLMALGQSAWLAWRRLKGLPLLWWSRLVGLVFY